MADTSWQIPDWFASAVAHEPDEATVESGGITINYLRWGEAGRPGLLFIHGGAAHAHWWSHIAPTFLPDYQVVAIDLSGHGDSGWRDDYRLDAWCDEVVAVIGACDFAAPPVIVGHSMGGFVTIATAARHQSRVAGAVIIDSPVLEVDPEVQHAQRTGDFAKAKTYDDPEIPIAKFRTIPPQAVYLPYVSEHVARRSLKQLDDGRWTWKFDPNIFIPERREAGEMLPDIRCRVALLRCEHGLVTPDVGDYIYQQLGRAAPVIELPTAGHHPMLDVPLILITALRSLLADWDHSHPLRPSAT